MATMNYKAFSSVLDALPQESDAEREEVRAPSMAFDYLAVADELHSGRIAVSQDMVAQEYSEASRLTELELEMLLAEVVIEDSPEPEASKQLSIDPSDIARELDLGGADLEELARIRRRFAFANHPDRLPMHLAASGMIRMQIANMLIDDACRSLGSPRR